MNTVNIVAPVIIMLLIGFICKRTGFIKEEGIVYIKKYITGIAIPVIVFHAVAVAEYNVRTLVIFGLMMGALIIGLFLGYLTKRIVSIKSRKFYPFLITAYEGGMLCYPLYQNLCGNEHFSNIVVVDLAACIFVFGVYIGLLQLVDRGEPFSVKKLALNAIKTPSFITLIIGLILGITGLMNNFLGMEVSKIYISVKDIVIAPVSPMILLCVGFSFCLKKELIKDVIKTILVRFVIQMALLAVVLLSLKNFGLDKYLIAAFMVYFLSTPNFLPPNYIKDEEVNQYIATTISLYCIITIVGYIIIAAVLF